jgi:formylglycine-generating enzyme required for sulfatase activity
LLGAPPFGDEDFLIVALRHQQDPVPRLPQSLAHWQPFFDRALAKRPQDRFATATEMAAALEQVEPQARPQPTSRRPLLVGAVLALLVALALGWWLRPMTADVAPAARAVGANDALAQVATAIQARHWFDGSADSADALLAPLFASEPVDAVALDQRDTLLDLASADLIAADDASLALRLPIWQRFVLDTRAVDLPPVRSVNAALEARWRPALERARSQRDRGEAGAELKLGSALPAPSPEFAELVELVGRFPARGEPFRDGDGPDLLLVPGGRLAGYSAPFAVTRFEITRADYKRFADATGRNAGGCRDGGRAYTWLNPGFEQSGADPVVCVSYADAVAYAGWLSRQSGRAYRLPSLAEWQALNAAARVDSCGNLRGENADCQDRYRATSPAGRFARAADLPADLIGNVREWTTTCEYRKANILKRTGTFLLNVPRKKENEVANPEQVCVARHVAGSGWRDAGGDRAATPADEDSAAVDRGFRLIREIR